VDLTPGIPEAPAEQPAEQSESQRSATLQHVTLTKQGWTTTESSPSDDPVLENLDDELEHLRRVAERIWKQRKIEELRRLITGKSTYTCGESLDALAEPSPPKQIVAEFATLPIQRATVYPSPYSGGCQKEFDEFVQ
jgi:hypothetical protein